jgi:phage-related protein
MSIIPINSANVQVALQNDAQQLRTTLSWLQQRYHIYNQNLTAANMTAAGISAADQVAVQNLINHMGRLIQFMTGTLPATTSDMRVDIDNITGVV